MFARPQACSVASCRILVHRSRTTNCRALFAQRPTRCSLPRDSCCNSDISRTSSLCSDWRDDAPQVVRASDHDVLHNAQRSCLILCYLCSKASFILSKAHFRGLYLRPEHAFVFFPVSTFQDAALMRLMSSAKLEKFPSWWCSASLTQWLFLFHFSDKGFMMYCKSELDKRVLSGSPAWFSVWGGIVCFLTSACAVARRC